MIICDLCSNSASLHICDKCYKIAKRLLEMYEENKLLGIDKPKAKKRGRPKKIVETSLPKHRGRPKKSSAQKVEVEIEKEKPGDPTLSKCWTCEFAFLGTGDKVACTEEKEPETCGQK